MILQQEETGLSTAPPNQLLLSSALMRVVGVEPGSVVVAELVPNTQAAQHAVLAAGLVLERVGRRDVRGLGLGTVQGIVRQHSQRPLTLLFGNDSIRI